MSYEVGTLDFTVKSSGVDFVKVTFQSAPTSWALCQLFSLEGGIVLLFFFISWDYNMTTSFPLLLLFSKLFHIPTPCSLLIVSHFNSCYMCVCVCTCAFLITYLSTYPVCMMLLVCTCFWVRPFGWPVGMLLNREDHFSGSQQKQWTSARLFFWLTCIHGWGSRLAESLGAMEMSSSFAILNLYGVMSSIKVTDQWESLPSFNSKFADVPVHHLYLSIHLCQGCELDQSGFLPLEMKTVICSRSGKSQTKDLESQILFFFFKQAMCIRTSVFFLPAHSW